MAYEMKSVINMCTYKSCQIGSSWMELLVQRNSPFASPSPSSVLSWVGGASNIGEGRGGERGTEGGRVEIARGINLNHWL